MYVFYVHRGRKLTSSTGTLRARGVAGATSLNGVGRAKAVRAAPATVAALPATIFITHKKQRGESIPGAVF